MKKKQNFIREINDLFYFMCRFKKEQTNKKNNKNTVVDHSLCENNVQRDAQ